MSKIMQPEGGPPAPILRSLLFYNQAKRRSTSQLPPTVKNIYPLNNDYCDSLISPTALGNVRKH